MKYLFVSNVPSPYRVNFFNQLSVHIDFTVLFESELLHDSKFNYIQFDQFKFNYIILSKGSLQPYSINRKIRSFILDPQYDHIIFMNYGYVTELYGLMLARRHKRSYSIEIDGAFSKKESILKRLIKQYVFHKATHILSPGHFTDLYFKHYHYQGNIYRYTFSSLTDRDIINNYTMHSYTHKKTWLYVGRWVTWKGYQDVLDVSRHFPNDTFIMITQFQQIKDLDVLKEKYPNVVFKDFMSTQDVFEEMKQAFALLLPTQNDIWGLVVNEAMSCGLPVITTTTCGAGLTLIEHEKDGFIYDVFDQQKLIDAMQQLDQKNKYESMSNLALQKIKNVTIEKMVEDHQHIFKIIESKGLS